EGTERLDAYGTIAADSPQVIAQEIDNHHVFGAVLGAHREFAAAKHVLLRAEVAARASPLDGTGLHLVPIDLEKALRRGAGDHEIADIQVRGKRRRIALA